MASAAKSDNGAQTQARLLSSEEGKDGRQPHKKQDREEKEASSRAAKTATIHRESEMAVEYPDGRVSPPAVIPIRTSARAPGQGRGRREAHTSTGPSSMYSEQTGVNGSSSVLCKGRRKGARQALTQNPSNEYDRRLMNAKSLNKSPIPCLSAIPWYHPTVTRHIAESLLLHKDLRDGTYLLRNSTQEDTLTLSARYHDAVCHYRVFWDGHQFNFGLGKFSDVESLLSHFEQQPLISGDSGSLLKLTFPYPQNVKEPHNYVDSFVVSMLAQELREEEEESKRKKAVGQGGREGEDTAPAFSVNSKEGFLTKLGYHRKNWKLRWFVLFKNELKYFCTETSETPLRTIDINDATSVERDYSIEKPFCFRLVTTYRTFFMLATSDDEADEWVKMLKWRLEITT